MRRAIYLLLSMAMAAACVATVAMVVKAVALPWPQESIDACIAHMGRYWVQMGCIVLGLGLFVALPLYVGINKVLFWRRWSATDCGFYVGILAMAVCLLFKIDTPIPNVADIRIPNFIASLFGGRFSLDGLSGIIPLGLLGCISEFLPIAPVQALFGGIMGIINRAFLFVNYVLSFAPIVLLAGGYGALAGMTARLTWMRLVMVYHERMQRQAMRHGQAQAGRGHRREQPQPTSSPQSHSMQRPPS